MTPRRLAHFELHELLGEGAMGQVYRAVDLQLDRPVAIKLLSGRTLGDASFLDRFKREARLAAQLNHPHIATIYAFGEAEGEAYIAMEFVEGETLAEVLARGPLSIPEAREFGRQAASALAVAHAKGIIHRDIKPGNLMITPKGELKVMDFGVARRSGETELTMAGSLIGTANIMAPELVQGADATPAADLFSLGCVLYEMVTGKPAFGGETAMAVLFQVVNTEPVALERARPDLPAEFRAIVHGLLVKDPAARLGPASVVANRLAGRAVGSPAETATPPPSAVGTLVLAPGETPLQPLPGPGTPSSTPTGPKRPRRLLLLLIGGAVLALIGVNVLVRLQDRGPDRRAIAEAKNQEGQLLAERFGDHPDSLARAFALFEEARAADSTYAPVWNNLGLLHKDQGQTDEAFADLEQAIKLDPSYEVPRYNLGQFYLERGDTSMAERMFSEAIAANPKYPEAHVGLARAREVRGDTLGAISSYRSAIAADPEFYQASNDLGFLLLQAGMPESALLVLDPAVEKSPKVAPLQKNLGEANRLLRRFGEADSAFARALVLRPDYGAALAGRAKVAEEQNNADMARQYWTQLLESSDPVLKAQAQDALARLGNRRR